MKLNKLPCEKVANGKIVKSVRPWPCQFWVTYIWRTLHWPYGELRVKILSFKTNQLALLSHTGFKMERNRYPTGIIWLCSSPKTVWWKNRECELFQKETTFSSIFKSIWALKSVLVHTNTLNCISFKDKSNFLKLHRPVCVSLALIKVPMLVVSSFDKKIALKSKKDATTYTKQPASRFPEVRNIFLE